MASIGGMLLYGATARGMSKIEQSGTNDALAIATHKAFGKRFLENILGLLRVCNCLDRVCLDITEGFS